MKKEVEETRMQYSCTYLSPGQEREGKTKIALAILLLFPVVILTILWNDFFGSAEQQKRHNIMENVNYSVVSETTMDELPSMKNYTLWTRPVEEKVVSMSAYTSREEETDSTPCISADGTNICQYNGCIVASNDYPFDTVVFIEGLGECVVKDRMSSRYTGTGNMDLYFGEDLEGAIEFGRQNMKIKITS